MRSAFWMVALAGIVGFLSLTGCGPPNNDPKPIKVIDDPRIERAKVDGGGGNEPKKIDEKPTKVDSQPPVRDD